MNRRQKRLMQLLLARFNDPVNINVLAVELDCSEKTVRNDLNQVEVILKEFPSSILSRKPGIGVSLKINDEDRNKLMNQVHQTITEETPEKELIITLAYQLLISEKALTLNTLATRLYTNKMVIRNYLDLIARWLEPYELKLISRQRVGNSIKGSELNKRNALAHLTELISPETDERKHVLDLFPAHEVNTVKKALNDMQHTFSIQLKQGEFESLLIHALIMLKRTRSRSPLPLDESKIKQTMELNSYQIAAWLLKQLGDTFKIKFPENEHIYFTWHLESIQQMNGSDSAYAQLITNIIQHLTTKMHFMAMVDFSQDKCLMDGLFTHLESTINRIHHGFIITNPMLNDIKQMYPYMFSMVVFALEDINDLYDLNIPEDEAAYLVLHFQAAVERKRKEKANVIKAVIVCDLGVGMSHLLQAKLEQHYTNMDITACLNKSELKHYLQVHTIDFVITTTDLQDTNVPNIKISPLFKETDKQQLSKFLRLLEKESSDTEKSLNSIAPFLDKDEIYLNVGMEHRFEIVELLSKNLFDKGYVHKAFIHSAMLREKASATGIGGGIAIPHATPESVKHSVVSLAILKEPIEWGDQTVSIVFLLAISEADQSRTKALMQTIASISQKPDIVEQLTKAKVPSDIMKVFPK